MLLKSVYLLKTILIIEFSIRNLRKHFFLKRNKLALGMNIAPFKNGIRSCNTTLGCCLISNNKHCWTEKEMLDDYPSAECFTLCIISSDPLV